MTVSNWVAVLLFAVLFICFLCLEREHQKRITSEFTAELRQSNIDELHRAIEKCEEKERASAELMRAKDERISVLENMFESKRAENIKLTAKIIELEKRLSEKDADIADKIEQIECYKEDLDIELRCNDASIREFLQSQVDFYASLATDYKQELEEQRCSSEALIADYQEEYNSAWELVGELMEEVRWLEGETYFLIEKFEPLERLQLLKVLEKRRAEANLSIDKKDAFDLEKPKGPIDTSDGLVDFIKEP